MQAVFLLRGLAEQKYAGVITLTISNRVAVSLSELLPPVAEQLQARLSLPNPVWQENRKRGYSNWKVPETLRLYALVGGRLFMPRGFNGQALGLLQEAGLAWQIDDQRRLLPEVDMQFSGNLKDYQHKAVAAALRRDFGTLAAPTGAGKTVMALAIIAARRP